VRVSEPGSERAEIVGGRSKKAREFFAVPSLVAARRVLKPPALLIVRYVRLRARCFVPTLRLRMGRPNWRAKAVDVIAAFGNGLFVVGWSGRNYLRARYAVFPPSARSTFITIARAPTLARVCCVLDYTDVGRAYHPPNLGIFDSLDCVGAAQRWR
jgi:hypothetical protein